MTTQEAADLCGIKVRRVKTLCENGKVENAKRLGYFWVIPTGTPKPIDSRMKAAKRSTQNDLSKIKYIYRGVS